MKLRLTWLHFCLCGAILFSLSCSQRTDPNTLVMIIESSPTNLDPRIGQDAQSQRIDGLIFDNLLTRDEHLNAAPGIATGWDIPDPLTYIFHLRTGVKFHDGRPLTSARREVELRQFDARQGPQLQGRDLSLC